MYTLLLSGMLLLGSEDSPNQPLSARPAAMVVTIKGELLAEGRLPKRRVEIGDFLLPGETITAIGEGEATLVFLFHGDRCRLRPGQRVDLTRDGARPTDALERLGVAKLSSKNLTKVREVEVSEGSGIGGQVLRHMLDMATPNPNIAPPLGTFVPTTRPRFAWPPFPKALEYTVEVKDGSDLIWKTTSKKAVLGYPTDKKPLDLGKKYFWTVKAQLGDDTSTVILEGANFKVLLNGEPEALSEIRKLAESHNVEDLLLAAAAYDGYKTYDEALVAFERLSQLRPDVRRFQLGLAHYYQLVGRTEEAKKSLDRAKALAVPVAK